MGMYLIFFVYGVPCILFLLFCLTPNGKQWLRQHNMLWERSAWFKPSGRDWFPDSPKRKYPPRHHTMPRRFLIYLLPSPPREGFLPCKRPSAERGVRLLSVCLTHCPRCFFPWTKNYMNNSCSARPLVACYRRDARITWTPSSARLSTY